MVNCGVKGLHEEVNVLKLNTRSPASTSGETERSLRFPLMRMSR